MKSYGCKRNQSSRCKGTTASCLQRHIPTIRACYPHICYAGPLPSLYPTCPVFYFVLHSHFFHSLPLLSPVNTTLKFSSGSTSSCSPFPTFPTAPLVAAATPGISLLCQWPLSCWSLSRTYQALQSLCIEFLFIP